ncbi:hypothetical protein ACN38_g6127 [Penicillium nordicum]|uniref:Uncharacterized protein n=1 Tax=Penicillium nordicum TaxID=229535 RepID=A0A0M9WFJ3_9EURO|nr:hypothetical protein ACN38_g6127 [Penicillium nordicum]
MPREISKRCYQPDVTAARDRVKSGRWWNGLYNGIIYSVFAEYTPYRSFYPISTALVLSTGTKCNIRSRNSGVLQRRSASTVNLFCTSAGTFERYSVNPIRRPTGQITLFSTLKLHQRRETQST